MIRRRALVLGAPLALLPGCKKSDGRARIAVVPKGTTHEFWKAVHGGAREAARAGNAHIDWKGPLREDDLRGQIDVVQSFVSQRVSGIVLAPLSDKALGVTVKAAVAAKIPVVIFDSDLKGADHVSFVATDNAAAGKIAANHLAKLLDGKGNVAVLRYQEGSASTQNREQGFLEGIRAHPGIKVVSDTQYGGATTETASSVSENLLSAQRAAPGGDGRAPGLAGVFCPNESTTFGMLLALKKMNLSKPKNPVITPKLSIPSQLPDGAIAPTSQVMSEIFVPHPQMKHLTLILKFGMRPVISRRPINCNVIPPVSSQISIST